MRPISGVAQTDTTRLLPTAEVVARRIDYFSLGQMRFQSDSQTLRIFQNNHLSDVIQSETPLSIKAYGTGLASLSMRGLAANHTAILWNGINLQNPLNGGLDLAILDVGTTDRISIKMGGCSALCGSGAIGGTVSIENTKPQQQGFHAQMGYGVGSVGWQNRTVQLGFGHSKISASVRIAQQDALNNFEFRNTAEIGQPLQKATHAAYNLLNINANLFVQASNKDILKFNFWKSSNYREITPTMTAASDHAIYRDTSNRLTGEWLHLFNKSFLKIRGAYLYDKNGYTSDGIPNSQNGIYSYIGEAEWNYNFSENHFLRAGFNLTADRSDNNNYLETHQRSRYALFLNDVFTTDFMALTANVRQEVIGETFTPTTFSTGFEKHLAKKTAQYTLILRGSLSRNFNIPTFNDLYWSRLGNPDLENEQGWSKEIGISYHLGKAVQKWEIHATLFDINIKNKIAWLPQSNGQWRPNNIAQVQTQGIETWAHYRVTHPNLSYKVGLNYQFAHATDHQGGVQLYTPVHKGSLSGWIQYRQWYAAWQQTASSKRYGTTDKTTWTDPFTNADATFGFTPSFERKRAHFNLKADLRLRLSNVFNSDYQVIRFYPNPKRQYRVEFLVHF